MSDGIRVKGKYLFQGEKKFYVRGVTYGTFGPDELGSPFPSLRTVEKDFARMAEAGINAVRVYTPPPLWLLNLAEERGVYVMVGLPWEQHIAFLDQPQLRTSIERRVRAEVKELGNHPAILCYVLGNEIPGSIVRWHGARRRIRSSTVTPSFLRRLNESDPGGSLAGCRNGFGCGSDAALDERQHDFQFLVDDRHRERLRGHRRRGGRREGETQCER